MTYEPIGKSKVINWFWVTMVLAAFAVALMWFIWDPSAGRDRDVPQGEAAASTEWTTAPEGEQVDVTLPDTPMRNVPQDEAETQGQETEGQ